MDPTRRIEIVQGDITTFEVGAVVNAANESLLGGGGVDGAIHRGAGPELLEECRTLKGCPTGQARITKGYNLPAGHVIHTVGPVWHGGGRNEAELLAGCYSNSLSVAVEHGISTIAFPSISTGVYRYPIDKACRIALKVTLAFLGSHELPEKVIFVCFSREDRDAYLSAFNELAS